MSRKDQILSLLQDNPSDSFLRFALAKEHEQAGEDAGAKAVYESIVQQDPEYVGTYYHLGKLLEKLGHPAAASRTYSTGIEITRRLGEKHAMRELMGARMELGEEE